MALRLARRMPGQRERPKRPFHPGVLSMAPVVVSTIQAEEPEELPRLFSRSSEITLPSFSKELKSLLLWYGDTSGRWKLPL